MAATILFVDDEPNILASHRRSLREFASEWSMHFCENGPDALAFLARCKADVVVTDITMPHFSGLELLKRIRAAEPICPPEVIMLTGLNDADLKRQALDLGASDLLNKPVRREEMIARIRSSLRLKRCQDELYRLNAELEDRVARRTSQLKASRLELIIRLGKAAEFRDEQTGNHVLRVARYAQQLAIAMGLPSGFTDTILLAAPLHDIGKIGIPDSILLKPGKLSPSERREMQKHCVYGARILTSSDELSQDFRRLAVFEEVIDCCAEDPVLVEARQIALCHHEWWNGKGYPQGLQGEQIPIAARIVAVADVFDALMSVRPYKPALDFSEALEVMHQLAGSQFDPQVWDAFLASVDQICSACRDLDECCAVEAASAYQLG